MLTLVTIVLDGMPYISEHLAEFQRLQLPWHWIIVEGQSENKADTAWCKPMPARLSNDGTTEYLETIKSHPNVTVIQRPLWGNKTIMFNTAMQHADKPGVLMQVDSDEMWTAEQLTKIVLIFYKNYNLQRMYFYCRYFIGEDLVTTYPGAIDHGTGNWLRAWRYRNGMRFNSHEPPVFNNNRGSGMGREATQKHGLVFNHYSWVQEKTVAFKEKFYGYDGALEGWKRLQANTVWPTKIKPFLHWVDDQAIAVKVTPNRSMVVAGLRPDVVATQTDLRHGEWGLPTRRHNVVPAKGHKSKDPRGLPLSKRNV